MPAIRRLPVQVGPRPDGAGGLKDAVAALRGVDTDFGAAAAEPHAPMPRGLPDPAAAMRTDAPRFAAPQVAETLIRHPGRSVEVTLNPEELGRVRMALASHDGAISVTITTDRIETLDLMRRHIDGLAQEFRRLGFDHVGFDFRQSGSGGQRTAQSGAAPPLQEAEPETIAPPPVQRPVAVSGLDMRV
ncbi:MAG: flagellar hook-length control protein FliK [Pseudooceanicola sp.]|nr:flagellar hook-length control protein FliK [Pseudooceanicola sp.]